MQWLKFLLIIFATILLCIGLYLHKVGSFPFRLVLKESRYSPRRLKYLFDPKGMGFGYSISELVRPASFYSDKRSDTMKYLLSIYPMAKDSLNSLNDMQLASFYNSLTYYYNPSFQYNGSDTGSLPNISNKWGPIPTSTPLPYPPQGYFTNFWTFQKYNIPWVYSDSDDSKEYLKLENFGACRPGLAFVTYVPGQKNGIRPGPGIQWVNCRSLERYIWYPNGPYNDKQLGNTNPDDDSWKVTQDLDKITWNYPKNWYKGCYDWLEVTHTEPVPGMVQSPGYWWNGFAGSGIFFHVGKTFVARNKVDAMIRLLKKLSSEQPDTLYQFFGTTDPYTIAFGFVGYCGNDPTTGFRYMDNRYTASGWCYPSMAVLSSNNALDISDFYHETVLYQKRNNISSLDTPTYEGIKAALDAVIYGENYNLDRMGTSVINDEPNFFFGSLLGYDTLQYVMSSNSNGYYQIEIHDLRMPDKYKAGVKDRNYTAFINVTDPAANSKPTNGSPWKNSFKKEFIQDMVTMYMEQSIICVRDPLDLYNENKVQKCLDLDKLSGLCPNITSYNGAWYNAFCSNVPMANTYKCLSLGQDADSGVLCDFSSSSPTC